MRNVENRAGRSCNWDRPSRVMTPCPSSVVRSRSAVSKAGSPKKSSPPAASSCATWRRMTPSVAADAPPRERKSSLPSGESRWLRTARRSDRSSSARPA